MRTSNNTVNGYNIKATALVVDILTDELKWECSLGCNDDRLQPQSEDYTFDIINLFLF